MFNSKSIGNKIAEARKKNNLSQAEFGATNRY
jgi:transcriptional regulator with XRE-family HTH domain